MEKPEAKHLHLWEGRSTVGFGVGAVLCKCFSVQAGGIEEKNRDSEGKKVHWIKACLPTAAEHDRSTFGFSCCGCENYSHDTVVCGYLDAEIQVVVDDT